MLENHQRFILQSYEELFNWLPLTNEIIQAFKNSNRHEYVDVFYSNVGAAPTAVGDTISEHYNTIYRDEPLILKISSSGEILSSVSQPSLVLYMINIADINKGDSVLEIGTATGWNASLISRLVGEDGFVDSIEIDSDLASKAQSNLEKSHVTNVTVYNQDGATGIQGKKYDVIMFTVGTYDIHKNLYRQLKDGGRLILVLKNQGGGDTLFSFKYSEGTLKSESGLPCGFVQIQGSHRLQELQPIKISNNQRLKSLFESNLFSKPFWFGGYKVGSFFWRTQAFRSFLCLTESCYTTVDFSEDGSTNENELGFGIYNDDEYSIAIFHQESLKCAGSDWARIQIEERLSEWVKCGMPAIASYKVEAMPKQSRRRKTRGELIISRDESTFYFMATL